MDDYFALRQSSKMRQPDQNARFHIARLGFDDMCDVVRFYEACDGCDIHPNASGIPYSILSASSCASLVDYVGYARLGKVISVSWIVFAVSFDGAVVVIDGGITSTRGHCLVCFPDTLHMKGYRPIVARSFSAFIDAALTSHFHPYWLSHGYVPEQYA